MNHITVQVSQIVQTLVGLEGSSEISIVSRRYPRVGPAEPGSGFEEQTAHFPISQIPADMPIPAQIDEVVIRVDGSLSQPDRANELRKRVHDFVDETGIGKNWDVRSRFRDVQSKRDYQFTVFTNYVPQGGTVDLA
jgi:hypothetical protein